LDGEFPLQRLKEHIIRSFACTLANAQAGRDPIGLGHSFIEKNAKNFGMANEFERKWNAILRQ
jgi:hypothetical protein